MNLGLQLRQSLRALPGHRPPAASLSGSQTAGGERRRASPPREPALLTVRLWGGAALRARCLGVWSQTLLLFPKASRALAGQSIPTSLSSAGSSRGAGQHRRKDRGVSQCFPAGEGRQGDSLGTSTSSPGSGMGTVQVAFSPAGDRPHLQRAAPAIQVPKAQIITAGFGGGAGTPTTRDWELSLGRR